MATFVIQFLCLCSLETVRYNKENVPSRAYISFKTAEQLSVFSTAYDGHVFRDKAGLSFSYITIDIYSPLKPQEMSQWLSSNLHHARRHLQRRRKQIPELRQ